MSRKGGGIVGRGQRALKVYPADPESFRGTTGEMQCSPSGSAVAPFHLHKLIPLFLVGALQVAFR